jgi:hypothetical protein
MKHTNEGTHNNRLDWDGLPFRYASGQAAAQAKRYPAEAISRI